MPGPSSIHRTLSCGGYSGSTRLLPSNPKATGPHEPVAWDPASCFRLRCTGRGEEADDLDGLGADVDEAVRDQGGDDGEVGRGQASAFVTDLGFCLADDDVEDLFCAVGVAG